MMILIIEIIKSFKQVYHAELVNKLINGSNKKAMDPSVFLSKVELDGLFLKFKKYDQTKTGTGHLSTQSLYDLLQGTPIFLTL